jgi:hypothetical protein
MTNESDDIYLNARQLLARYGGKSQMWLYRRLRDDPSFPRPIYIAKHRYWKLSTQVEWEKQQAANPAPSPRTPRKQTVEEFKAAERAAWEDLKESAR